MEWIYGGIFSLIIGLGVGLFIGRRLSSHPFQEAKESKVAFLTGFRYLLSNEPDRAIEAFMKAVSLDTDTVETYFALASLFRDKGEIERAIRIHQSIITRPHLEPEIRLQALYDLALDYKKAGLLDRAINTFKEVIRKDPAKKEAYLELANLYQSLKDWQAAYETIERLSKFTKEDYSLMLAHFLVEIGKKHQKEGNKKEAESFYKKAIKTNKKCTDAYLHLGDLYFEEKNFKKAFNIWENVIELTPEYSFLVYSRLEKHFSEIKDEKAFNKFIKIIEEKKERDIFSSIFIGKFCLIKKDLEKAKFYFNEVLEEEPSQPSASQFMAQILLEEGKTQEAIELLKKIPETLPKQIYQCSHCGYESIKLYWHCPKCGEWDTIKPKTKL